MKVKPKNNIEIKKMRAAGKLAGQVLDYITPFVEPGISTLKLNDLCAEFTEKHGALSAPLNYRGFPKSICTSLNDVVCHGIPSAEDILKDGDILNIDITVILDGYHGDTSRMFISGDTSKENKKLIQHTYDAMMLGISQIESGAMLSKIGKSIQPFCENAGYGVVREYCGHGIGSVFHEEPAVLHYDPQNPEYDLKLRKGMTFTVEPMVNIGTAGNHLLPDEWTVKTNDGKNSAQFEHTLAVTADGCEIFTLSSEGYTCPPYK